MEFIDLGLIDYAEALSYQESLVDQRYKNLIPDTVIFCSHPPVVTLGRSTQKEDLQGWSGATYEVRRGGRATYHGPNQLVIYPIINLDQNSFSSLKNKDVMKFLTQFEMTVLNTFKDLDFNNFYLKEDVEFDSSGKKLLNRGLWANSKKIAAFGIAVRKWVTYHGCAINLYKDEQGFKGISPCGFKPTDVGYLEDVGAFELNSLKYVLKKNIKIYLQ